MSGRGVQPRKRKGSRKDESSYAEQRFRTSALYQSYTDRLTLRDALLFQQIHMRVEIRGAGACH